MGYCKNYLYLNEEPISDASMYDHNGRIMHLITWNGSKTFLKLGFHKIKACVNEYELHIPHLDYNGIEYKIKPIFGNLLVIRYY